MEDKDYLKYILPKLAAPMSYKWRVQSYSKYSPQAVCVAYVDARDVQDRLDDVCEYGWERDHREIKGHIYAGIGIWMPSGRVMWRWDCGVESNTEAEKGESSDSFKRAAVNFGIGRFLYTLAVVKLKASEIKTKTNNPHVVDDYGKKVWNITKYINEKNKGGSASGKPADFDSANEGSTPSPPARNWTEEIRTASTLDELKAIYEEGYRATKGQERAKITREKDKRKQELKEKD